MKNYVKNIIKKYIFNYKVFYLLQSLFKYIPFRIFSKIRPWIYKPFFKHIGKNVEIFDGVHFKFPSEIEIGENTKIEHCCFIVGKGGLKIGNYVMMGAGTKIVTTSHNYSKIEKPMYNQGISYQPIIIEDDIWFGFDCIILKGSKIGKGSIVAANSVITGKNFPPYSIIGGTPAKIIKWRNKL